MYRIHKLLASWIVILLTLHFTLLVLKYAQISLISGYEFVKPTLEVAYIAGRMGLILLVLITVWTMYFRIPYRRFVLAMRVLGLSVFLGTFHALTIPGSDLRKNIPLLIYIAGLTGAAAAVYVYRSLLHKRAGKEATYEITKVQVRQNITDVHLRPLGQPLQRYAGQFAFIRFDDPLIDNESHPFTISAGSSERNLRFCIKGLGDFTTSIQSVKPGTKVFVDAPYGNFSFTKIPSQRQVWIAGGIGITPVLSMAASLPPSGYQVDLFYCVRTKQEAIFFEELQQVAQKITGLTITLVASDADGEITTDRILASTSKDAAFLLCGPVGMMKSLERQLLQRNIKQSKINYEEFSLS